MVAKFHRMSIPSQICITDVLANAHLFYQAETRGVLSATQLKKLDGPRINSHRIVQGRAHPKKTNRHYSDLEALAAARRLPLAL
eukprot:7952212-Pyramimonas_sp.AAC.1